ncbi:hypothetical protein [Thermococcus barophilus]|nr:hypothetical protein [Thermococcus barophilus]
MALPAVVMAYKEKDSLIKLIVYAFVGIAVIYFLWKIYKTIKNPGESIGGYVKSRIKDSWNKFVEEFKENPVNAVVNALKKNVVTAPTVYAGEYGYELGKKLAKEHPETAKALASGILPPLGFYAQVKDFIRKWREKRNRVKPTYKTNKEIMAIEGKRWEARFKAWNKPEVKYKTNEELAKISGKRWEAIARYYKRRRPASPLPERMRIKPILKPPKYKPAVMPPERVVIAL